MITLRKRAAIICPSLIQLLPAYYYYTFVPGLLRDKHVAMMPDINSNFSALLIHARV